MEEPVARMQSIKPIDKQSPTQVWVTRWLGSEMHPTLTMLAIEGTLLYVGDVVKTGKSTMAALEFLIGGRVGINKDAAIEIVNERSVAPFGEAVAQTIGQTWKNSSSAWKLKEPLEIQTNGGTLGGLKG